MSEKIPHNVVRGQGVYVAPTAYLAGELRGFDVPLHDEGNVPRGEGKAGRGRKSGTVRDFPQNNLHFEVEYENRLFDSRFFQNLGMNLSRKSRRVSVDADNGRMPGAHVGGHP